MSLTMQHIISDAQTLCTRLKDHESRADMLISQARSLYKQVDAMKQYEEEVVELNEAAHQKPRDALVQGIQQENRRLRELQQENKELRNSLEEHQNTLEIVMSNYRKQVTKLMEINKSDRQLQLQQRGAQIGDGAHAQAVDVALLETQSNKIQEMAQVMRRALELDEQSEHRAQEAIAQLTKENKGLRELLRVTYSYIPEQPPAPPTPAPAQPATPEASSPASSPGKSPSPSSFQTVRRRPSTESPAAAAAAAASGSKANFQTVRRRPQTAGSPGKESGSPAGSPASSPASSPVKSPVQVRSPGEVKVPPMPTSAPPKVPALAARAPAVTVKAAPVPVRPTPAAGAGEGQGSATAPASQTTQVAQSAPQVTGEPASAPGEASTQSAGDTTSPTIKAEPSPSPSPSPSPEKPSSPTQKKTESAEQKPASETPTPAASQSPDKPAPPN